MTPLASILENEQVILGPAGEPEYVVLPIAKYARFLQLLEDMGLSQAILEADREPRFTKSEALGFLKVED